MCGEVWSVCLLGHKAETGAFVEKCKVSTYWVIKQGKVLCVEKWRVSTFWVMK